MSADDDRISAYLDDELTSAERAQFDAELATRAELAEAVREVDDVRRALRSLPAVEPPAGLYRRLSPRRRVGPLAAKAAAVAAVAALIFMIIGFASGTPGAGIVPAFDDYFDQHASAAAAGFAPVAMSEAKTSAPDMAPMELVAAFRRGDVMHYRYVAGPMGEVSVFVETGRCEFDKLPAGGATMQLPGSDAWHDADMKGQAVVVREGRSGGRKVVYTVIGAAAADALVVETASHLR